MYRLRSGAGHTPFSVSSGMERQLTALVERPSQATFLAARDAVLGVAGLPLVATDLANLEQLLTDGQSQAVIDRIDTLPPSKVLSPRIHFLAAEAAEDLGDAATVELERSLFVITLQGLLATGNGTPGNPYIVCHPTDEYDIAEALGLEPAGQSLIEQSGRLFDVLVCSDGRELWFDVTDILARQELRKRRRARPRRAAARRVSRAAR
jgi:hypothetical protein